MDSPAVQAQLGCGLGALPLLPPVSLPSGSPAGRRQRPAAAGARLRQALPHSRAPCLAAGPLPAVPGSVRAPAGCAAGAGGCCRGISQGRSPLSTVALSESCGGRSAAVEAAHFDFFFFPEASEHFWWDLRIPTGSGALLGSRVCEPVRTWSEFHIPLLRNGELARGRSFGEEKLFWCIAVAVFFPSFSDSPHGAFFFPVCLFCFV